LKQFSLSKQERLKSRKQIEFLFKEGKAFSISPVKVYYSFANVKDGEGSISLQFGAGVGTRNFKKAPHRNKIKRLLREAYRLQKNELKQALEQKQVNLSVFFIFTGKDLPDYQFVVEKTGTALQKLIKLAYENS
jgi:ribonuclease P protein component